MTSAGDDVVLPYLYVLDGHIPVAIGDAEEWEAKFRHIHVDYNVLPNGIIVSTIFLGIDTTMGFGGRPLLFETMIFGGKRDLWQERTSTWAEAEQMHKEALALALSEAAVQAALAGAEAAAQASKK